MSHSSRAHHRPSRGRRSTAAVCASGAAAVWRGVLRSPALAGALAVLLVMVVLAVLGPWVTPHDPLAQDLSRGLEGPTWTHPLGTDELGRDTLSRLIASTRTSMLAATYAVGIALLLGTVPGLLAGYFRGWVDYLLMRATDVLMAFPALVLAIAIVGVLGPGLRNAMIAVGVVFAPRFARLTRSLVHAVRSETYIDASRTVGTSDGRIIQRHVLPNIANPLMVQVAITFGFAMLAEAGLSFIGLGVQPPESSWGSMLSRASRHLDRAPLLIVYPGIAITMAVLALNVIGDRARSGFAADRPGSRR